MLFRSKICCVMVLLGLMFGSMKGNAVVDSLEQLRQRLGPSPEKVDALAELCWEYQYEDFFRAKARAAEGLKMAQKIGYAEGTAKIQGYLAVAYRIHGQLDSALELHRAALAGYKNIGNKRGETIQYSNMSVVWKELGDFEAALEVLFLATEAFLEMGDWRNVGGAYTNIGNNYAIMGDTSQSIKYFEKAVAANEKSGDKYVAALTFANLGGAYAARFRRTKEAEDFQAGVGYLAKAFQHHAATGNQYAAATVMQNQSELYATAGDHSLADSLAAAALEIFRAAEDYASIADIQLHRGGLFFNTGRTARSITVVREALDLARRYQLPERARDAHLRLSEYFQQQGQFETALQHMQQHRLLSDSLFRAAQAQAVATAEVRFESEKRKREFEQSEKSRIAAELAVSRRNTWLWGGGIGILALALIGWLYLRQRRAAERHRRAILEHRALRAQMNPHFIYNSLNSIQRMYLEGNTAVAIDYTADFSRLLRAILDSSDRHFVSLREELNTLELYLRIESARLGQQLHWSVDCDPTLDALNIRVPALVLQPFVENAIWHGIVPLDRPGTVEVIAQPMPDGRLNCTITDDGVGIYTRQKAMAGEAPTHTSRGMQITRERLGAQGHLHVSERPEGGTEINLILPVTYETESRYH
ncbi:MAG: histidine kinase [Bacteroidota bacterium]